MDIKRVKQAKPAAAGGAKPVDKASGRTGARAAAPAPSADKPRHRPDSDDDELPLPRKKATGMKRKRPQAEPASVSAATDDDGEGAGEAVPAAATGGVKGFGQAMAKILARTVDAGVAPVLAKRHTAAEKLAEAERAAELEEREKRQKRRAAKRAHLAQADAANPDFERQLRRVATKGGEWRRCGDRRDLALWEVHFCAWLPSPR
jgi:hypothetical protein